MQHVAITHLRFRREAGGELVELDPAPPDLDLAVMSADELPVAAGMQPHELA